MGRGYPAELSSDCHAPPVKDPVLDSLHSAVFFAFPWPSPLCLEGLLAQSPLDQGLTLCGKVDLVQLKGPCILSLSFILAPALLCALLQPRAFLCHRHLSGHLTLKASLPQEPHPCPRATQEVLLPPGAWLSPFWSRGFLEILTVYPLYLKEECVPAICL